MPFVNKQKCNECTKYKDDHIKRYWVSCDITCKIYTRMFIFKNFKKKD